MRKWPKLIAWLEEKEYFTAPASKDHHGAHEGGLIEHSLQVAYELERITVKMGLKWERPESPEIIGLLHDVCKLDDYYAVSLEEPRKIEYEYKKERLYPGHGDKSLIMLMGLIDLTEEEKMCIRYHYGSVHRKVRMGVLQPGGAEIPECSVDTYSRYDSFSDKGRVKV